MSVYAGKWTLVATVGLPKSGKSTWIYHNALGRGIPVVSLDAIRMALTGKVFEPEREPEVWDLARFIVHVLFLGGHTIVVVDECNNTINQRLIWKSDLWQTLFKVFDTPVAVCIERAKASHDEYLIPVIERKAAEFEELTDQEVECVGIYDAF